MVILLPYVLAAAAAMDGRDRVDPGDRDAIQSRTHRADKPGSAGKEPLIPLTRATMGHQSVNAPSVGPGNNP